MEENKIFIYINMDLIDYILDIIKDYKKECSEEIKDIYIKILIFPILSFILGLFALLISYFQNLDVIKYIYLIPANLIILSLSIWIIYDTYKIPENYLVLYILSILSTIFYIIISILAFKTISINNQILLTLFINLLIVLLFFFGPCDKIKHSCNVESWPNYAKSDDSINKEEFCNKLNETCMEDMNKSEDECGNCSDTNYNNKDDCLDNNKEWTSKYTKCFWAEPTDKSLSSCDITTNSTPLEPHEGNCIYDIEKCLNFDCGNFDDFQPTSVFYDCCPIENWETIDCDSLTSAIDANEEGRRGELRIEYEHRFRAMRENTERSDIVDMKLYE